MISIPRIARKNLNTSFFHVIVQGINKEYIFNKERYINRYLQLIQKNFYRDNLRLIAFCMMNNHAHLLIKVEKIEELSRCMQKINSSYAKYYNYMEDGRTGYVFRDRYKSEPIKDRMHLLYCIKYIHQNPVKASMVDCQDKYKYSSYKYYKDNTYNDLFTKEELDFINNQEARYSQNFLDIDRNIDEIIDDAISEFIIKENVKVFEIFQKNDILKKLIKYLKYKKNIKYTNIMKRLDITKGTMERLKK